MKVVINCCFGGYGLSPAAVEWIRTRGEGRESYPGDDGRYALISERAHPVLVACVESLGEQANGPCADLRVIEIPDGIKWHVHEYDGMEHVAEDHRTWGAS